MLIEGKIPIVIPDTATDARVVDLSATQMVGIGAFTGVPLRHSGGTRYGTPIGIAHTPDPTLGTRDVRFMTMLGELIVDDLDEQCRQDELRAAPVDLIETESIKITFQPIIEIRSGDCLGVEALSRSPPPFGRPDHLFAQVASVGPGLDLERMTIQGRGIASALAVRG